MKIFSFIFLFLLMLSSCKNGNFSSGNISRLTLPSALTNPIEKEEETIYFTRETLISEVVEDPTFSGYGNLIFPVNRSYYQGSTLEDLRLTWYNNIDPDNTVEIVNYMKANAESGNTIFFDIYTDEEKRQDPAKQNTGLFYFKGNPGEKFAICNAGGGFAYVGAMHDSFPHALELSKNGYNAFALIYRPGSITAMEDLARAIAFIFENAEELEVDTDNYSLWGGSAGARMAADLGHFGTRYFGEREYPRPSAVIMQYTGYTRFSRNDPPTFAVVGDRDGIASWVVMEQRINNLQTQGVDAQIHIYDGLSHGFGLGNGTVAEGWIDRAIRFWERQSN